MNTHVLLKAAHRLMELGDFEQAETAYTQLILAGLDKVEVFNNRGSARFALGKYERAIRDYSKAIQLDPRIDYPHFNRANCKFEMGDLDGAIRDYERALQFNPGHSRSHLNRAFSYQKKDEHVKALADFQLYKEQSGSFSAEVLELRSESFFALGREEEGMKDLYRALDLKDSGKSLYLRLLDLHLEKGEFKEALTLSKRALKAYPEGQELKLKRAECFVRADAPALAWTDLDALDDEKEEGNAAYFFLKGKILDSLNRFSEAIELLRKSIYLNPEDIESWLVLAGVYFKSKDFLKCIDATERVKELNRDFPETYLLAAKANYELGKFYAANAQLELYEARGGDIPEAYLLKGFALIERQMFEEAIRAFDKAIRLNPQNPDAYLGRGNASLANSQYENALKSYDQALEIAPDFRAVHFNRGVALKNLGKPQSAIQAWERAADLHHPKAEAYLRRYRKKPDA
ncbi:MAG: tetratricopeptide repeat protein [Bacteroidia bacterium]|nr:tetratricopeptide repeat protein [Bacteroidia bacterium]